MAPDLAVDWWLTRQSDKGKARQLEDLMHHWSQTDFAAASQCKRSTVP